MSDPTAGVREGEEPDPLALEDYKLKLGYLTAEFDRLWTRFNFLLSLETALFGFLGVAVLEHAWWHAALIPILLGVAVSGLWYVVGAQDRALVEEYRTRADRAADRVARAPGRGWFAEEHPAQAVGDVTHDRFSWYRQATSVTRLPALVGFALLCLWALLLAAWIVALAAGLMPGPAPPPAP